MTKKKKKAYRSKLNENELSGPIIFDDYLYFSPLDLTRYELAQHKLANSLQGIKLKQAEIERVRKKAEDDIRTLNTAILQLQSTVKIQEQELKELQESIGELYKIDMSVVSYDDKTGKLFIEDEPLSVKTKTKKKTARK